MYLAEGWIVSGTTRVCVEVYNSNPCPPPVGVELLQSVVQSVNGSPNYFLLYVVVAKPLSRRQLRSAKAH